VLLLTMLPQTFLLPTASAASSSFTPTIDGDAEVLNALGIRHCHCPLLRLLAGTGRWPCRRQ
jgi:hypothetical protein